MPRSRRPRYRVRLVALVVAACCAGPVLVDGGEPSAASARDAALSSALAAAAPEARPNIVLITTDDQAAADLAWMPRTKALLGDQGATFRQMLSPHPLCCPARAEMVTGQFAQNNGVRTNGGPHGGLAALKDPDNTLAAWLSDAGYATAMTGKYLNGYTAEVGVPGGWDFWNVFLGVKIGYYTFSMFDGATETAYSDGATYSSDLITGDAVSRIDALSRGNRPFFLWASYYAPHADSAGEYGWKPPTPATRHEGSFAGVPSPSLEKPSFNESVVSDKPRWIRTQDPKPAAAVQSLFEKRLESLAAVDEGVASVVEALSRAGELDNTLILFTSDNGFLMGEHRFMGKVVPYEESIRVPLLMRGPGVPAGVTVTGTTATTVDLAPTIAAAAGVVPGRVPDGVDLLPVLTGATSYPDRTVLIQAGPRRGSLDTAAWLYRGVRTNRYTFVRWEDRFLELYDRKRDPFQEVNRSADPRYASIRRALAQRLGVLRTCAGETCYRAWPGLPAPRRRS